MISVQVFVVNYFSENTYVVFDETKEAVLIDCGCMRPEEMAELNRFIEQNGLTLVHYICTHLHLDHTFGNAFVLDTYGLGPEASVADVEGLPSAEQQAVAFGLRKAIKSVPLANDLREGDVVRFGDSELRVIAVPGHTPGGLAFYNEKEGFVMVGDSLFMGSVGRTDLWGGDAEALVSALREKLMALPDDTIVYPGHGPTTTIGHEKMNNPYF